MIPTTFSNPKTVMQLAKSLFPPETIIHIGWGHGQGELSNWWSWKIPNAILIEAEISKLQTWKTQVISGPINYQALNVTVGAKTTDNKSYFVASNPAESGLVSPAHLRNIWSQLYCVDELKMEVQTLDDVVGSFVPSSFTYFPSFWLIVDCFPSIEILSGALETLKHCSVVMFRSIKSQLSHLMEQMQDTGLAPIAWTESNHPDIGYVWYCRKPLSIANAVRDFEAIKISQLISERDAETQDKILAQAQRDAEVKEKARALFERDVEAQAKVEALVQCEIKTKELTEALSHRDKEAITSTDLISLQQEKSQLLQKIELLEAEKNDKEYRQQLLQEELLRAEAQIDLIKELILREPNL